MNDYSRQELNDLKARVDIAEVFRATGLELSKVGKGLFCRCPFHEDDEASLSVTPAEGLWNCFGCEAGGDVPEHNPGFVLDDAILPVGASIYARIAERRLAA